MAFQPIVNIQDQTVFAYEALVRGLNNEGAGQILSQVTEENVYAFDQSCRLKAIEVATKLNMQDTHAKLSINFLPNAIYTPETCIRATLAAAKRHQFPLDRLLFEVTETEKVRDNAHLKEIIEEYKKQGFLTAIDDFGAGYAGLNLLVDFQPDIIKLDMALIRDIDTKHVNKSILAGIIKVCKDLGVLVIAEGVETEGEAQAVKEMDVHLHQGYLYAKPGFETLPVPDFPEY